MWVHINTIAKTIVFHTNQGGNIPQIKSYKISTNYCRKHRKFAKFINLHNRVQHSEKLSPIISKLAFSQSATAIVLQTSVNCSHSELSKQQLTAHTSIVKIIWQSVTNTHYSLQMHHSCHWC